VHAFRCARAGNGVAAGDEFAVWERANTTVTAEETGAGMKVVIERAGGERLVCSTGQEELSRAVVEAMQDRVRVAA
jgi:hypothetical protein